MNFYGSASANLRDPLTLARAGLLSRALSAVDGGVRPAKIGEMPGGQTVAARRELTEQAQATVMSRQHITGEEAFYWLVRQSRREGRSIFATARAVMRPAGSGDS
jgi:AmiR/NasT family two-component response regulator